MIVAALPIEPPDGDKCWAFHVINDEPEPIESIVVESVSYEYGDSGNSEAIGRTFGRVARGANVEVYRETSTELRTSLMLRVRIGGRDRRIDAEVGRLYAPRSSALEDIPILRARGKLAELTEY